jgi:hypothetical protein
MQELRYRLRQGEHIVGYLRVVGSTHFYSKDSFWWNGEPISHEAKDAWTGLKDRNNTHLYSGDIVEFEPIPGEDLDMGAMLLRDGIWVLKSVTTDTEYPIHALGLSLYQGKDVRWLSYLFLNEELSESWGIWED